VESRNYSNRTSLTDCFMVDYAHQVLVLKESAANNVSLTRCEPYTVLG